MCVIEYIMNMKDVIFRFSEYIFNFGDFGLELISVYVCVLTC